MSTFNNYLPFTVLKLLHSNLTHLRTNADSKYEIVDVKVTKIDPIYPLNQNPLTN